MKDRLATSMGLQQHQNCQLDTEEPWSVNTLWTSSPMTSPQRSHLYLQSSPARHCRVEPGSSCSFGGEAAVWHSCLAWPGAAVLPDAMDDVPDFHLCLKMNPSQIVELGQPPKEVCCVLSLLSRTSVVCAAELLFLSPSQGCTRCQEGRRDYPAFNPAVLWESEGDAPLCSPLLPLSGHWRTLVSADVMRVFEKKALVFQSLSAPGNICDSAY